ncbi:hypothetical protein, partial [Laceyella putida]
GHFNASFLPSLLYSISNFQGAFFCDHRIAATKINLTHIKKMRKGFFYFSSGPTHHSATTTLETSKVMASPPANTACLS